MAIIEWSVIAAFMKLQSLLAVIIIILFKYCEKFPRGVLSMLIKYGKEICGRKGIHQNGLFIYLVGPNVWIEFIG